MREDVARLLRDTCSLPDAVEVIGERWCFMILRAAFHGVVHFEDFLEATGIARNILANRLSRLTDAGIMTRRPCQHDKRKIEYMLTPKGHALLTTIIALRQWGEKWESCVPSNPVLCDRRDRQPIAPIRIVAHDGRELTVADLCWIDESEIAEAEATQRALVPDLRSVGAER